MENLRAPQPCVPKGQDLEGYLPLARTLGASRLHRKISTTSMASGDKGRKVSLCTGDPHPSPRPGQGLRRAPGSILSTLHTVKVQATEWKWLTLTELLQRAPHALI